MHPSSSSPQWLCGNMSAMDSQWQSSHIASVRLFMLFFAPSLVLVEHSVGSNTSNAWTPSLAVHSRYVTTKSLWWWGGWVHNCLHDVTIYIYIYILYIYIYIYIYSDVIKTIQCAHPPHPYNGFVVTCWLWMARGGVHASLVLQPTECSTSNSLEV